METEKQRKQGERQRHCSPKDPPRAARAKLGTAVSTGMTEH